MGMGKRRHRPPVPRNSRGRSPSSRRPTVSQARPMVADRGTGPAGNTAVGRARRPTLAPSRGAWCAGSGLAPAALVAARGTAGRPRPTARGAGRGRASSPTGCRGTGVRWGGQHGGASSRTDRGAASPGASPNGPYGSARRCRGPWGGLPRRRSQSCSLRSSPPPAT